MFLQYLIPFPNHFRQSCPPCFPQKVTNPDRKYANIRICHSVNAGTNEDTAPLFSPFSTSTLPWRLICKYRISFTIFAEIRAPTYYFFNGFQRDLRRTFYWLDDCFHFVTIWKFNPLMVSDNKLKLTTLQKISTSKFNFWCNGEETSSCLNLHWLHDSIYSVCHFKFL